MRALQLTGGFGLDHLQLNELPEPSPGPGQVLIRVRAVSLNYRDLLVAKGLYSKKLPLPLTICSDAAGEVIAVGAGVTRVKEGDRVAAIFMQGWLSGEPSEAKARTALGAAAPGVLCERLLLQEEGVVHVPEHLSWEEAATLPCAGVTAWHALMVKGGLKCGDTVLTLGTGGVSLFAVQFAHMAGARIISTSSQDEKLERLEELGAHETINYTTDPDWEETVRKLTPGGVDHVVEVGGAGTLPQSVRATRMGGKIHLIGNLATKEGATECNPLPAMMKGITIHGIFVGSRDMFEEMARAVEVHQMRPVVDHIFPFEQSADALRHMEQGGHFGKICIGLD
ncbi:MAG: NAD(P)-dependent alcohol dehydrogenase [Acidimicrobiia bacterium]|nr:NAD(P)-dependent alcohol dehydrogenase [Acidimicrobiia bacterium]